MKMIVVPEVELASGEKMPRLGMGTYKVVDEENFNNSLQLALDAGYRHFDTAFAYVNQHKIGEFFEKVFQSGQFKRSDIFFTTKVRANFMDSKDHVKNCVELCLKELRLDYIDLCLFHSPFVMEYVSDHQEIVGDPILFVHDKQALVRAWQALEDLVDEGKIRSIGLSNFNSEQITRINNEARKPISCLQVECHLYFQQKKMKAFCESHNIQLIGYAPLGSQGPLGATSLGIATSFSSNAPLQDENVKIMAERYKKTSAQIMLRYQIQRNVLIIPRSTNKQRIFQNVDVFDFELTPDDMAELERMDKIERIFRAGGLKKKNHPEYPYDLEF